MSTHRVEAFAISAGDDILRPELVMQLSPATERTAAGGWIHLALLLSGVAALVWSGIGPHDRATWAAEVAPAVVGWVVLLATYRRFRFTTLAYVLAWWFSLILIVGGHYTYARVPVGLWVRDALDLTRNHYDRVGHFFQGFAPAILAREVLLRTSPLRTGKWLFVIVTAMCLAVSAMYEFIEWWAALAAGGTADKFLALQGDVWDTQWDMFLAGCGAVAAQLLLGRYHSRAVRRLGQN